MASKDKRKKASKREPYYEPIGDELEVFSSAYKNKLPILLKGPTGCGKTRFVEYMAWKLQQKLITVACHDDLTSSDLVGRYLVKGGQTEWIDGPLTEAVRNGYICYLDEIVEARKDTTVVIHPLCDDRRILPIEKLGEFLSAPLEFSLVISYNPGYQSILKDLKQSTRQRFVAIEFDYPTQELELKILITESKIKKQLGEKLIKFGQMTRNLKEAGLEEGASTRLLVNAAKLINGGICPYTATNTAVALPLTDDSEMLRALDELSKTIF